MSAFVEFAAGQPVVLGTLLALAGSSKLSMQGRVVAEATALAKLIRRRSRLRRTWVAFGLLELATAAALLVDARPASTIAAAALLLSAAAYSHWTWIGHRDSSCGCFGARSVQRVTGKTVLRIDLIVALAVLALFARMPWWETPAWVWLALGTELGIIIIISPERRVVVDGANGMVFQLCRVYRPLAGPFIARSRAWQHLLEAYPDGQPALVDTWHVGCWRLLAYSLTKDGTGPNAVFAIPPLWPLRPIKGSIADAGSRTIVEVLA